MVALDQIMIEKLNCRREGFIQELRNKFQKTINQKTISKYSKPV